MCREREKGKKIELRLRGQAKVRDKSGRQGWVRGDGTEKDFILVEVNPWLLLLMCQLVGSNRMEVEGGREQ